MYDSKSRFREESEAPLRGKTNTAERRYRLLTFETAVRATQVIWPAFQSRLTADCWEQVSKPPRGGDIYQPASPATGRRAIVPAHPLAHHRGRSGREPPIPVTVTAKPSGLH